MRKIPKIRDIDIFDDISNKLLGTIKNSLSYKDAMIRAGKELNIPFTQYEYIFRNTYNRTGKWINNEN